MQARQSFPLTVIYSISASVNTCIFSRGSNRQLQCKRVKIYQAQTPYLAIRKILVK